MIRFLLFLTALFTLAAPASAYWDFGHRVIAGIAEARMTPQARAEMRRLIAASPDLLTPTCPIDDIGDASVWADCIKGLGDRFSYAYSWHYQNVDVCEPFDLEAPCAGGHCVSAQIERNMRLLANREVPRRERLQALAFLVHFVGDMHMPLHAGDREDRGGNDVEASYGLVRANLHMIWDGYLAERAITTPPGGVAGLLRAYPDAARWEGGSVEDWARDSWQVSREFAYGALLDDPCAPLPEGRQLMANPVIEELITVAREQVVKGGVRLARLLNEALG